MIDLTRQRLTSYHARDALEEEQAIKEILQEVEGLTEFGLQSQVLDKSKMDRNIRRLAAKSHSIAICGLHKGEGLHPAFNGYLEPQIAEPGRSGFEHYLSDHRRSGRYCGALKYPLRHLFLVSRGILKLMDTHAGHGPQRSARQNSSRWIVGLNRAGHHYRAVPDITVGRVSRRLVRRRVPCGSCRETTDNGQCDLLLDLLTPNLAHSLLQRVDVADLVVEVCTY